MSRQIRLCSPAKINLHLRVGGPDTSGFHPLRSWMITTSLHDELAAEFEPADISDGPLRLSLRADVASVPTDASNLVLRAAEALIDSSARRYRGSLVFALTKRTPIGAGLGGGSSNAAAALVAVNELLDLGCGRQELSSTAQTIGSDVAFFLGEPSAIATGRGGRLEPTPPPRAARHALLVLPPFGISTPAAYRVLDRLRPLADPSTLDPFDAAVWATLPARPLLERLHNDLEPAAFALEPRLADLRSALEETLGRPVRMSGSGSTLFTLYDDADGATHAAGVVATRHAIPTHAVLLGAATIVPRAPHSPAPPV